MTTTLLPGLSHSPERFRSVVRTPSLVVLWSRTLKVVNKVKETFPLGVRDEREKGEECPSSIHVSVRTSTRSHPQGTLRGGDGEVEEPALGEDEVENDR